jgi:hypothetical protein
MTGQRERIARQTPDLYEMIMALAANTASVILGADESGAYIHSTLAQLAPLRLVDGAGEGRDRLSLSLLAQLYLRNSADALRVLLIEPRQRLSRLFHACPQTRLVATGPASIALALSTLHQELTRRQRSPLPAPPWLVFIEEGHTLWQDAQTWESFRVLIAQGHEVGLFVVVASSLAGPPDVADSPLPAFRSTAIFSPVCRESLPGDQVLDERCEPEQPTGFVFEQEDEAGRTRRNVVPPFVDTRLLFLLATGWGG